MRTYNAIMSSVFTGIVVHELTHAVFFSRVDFIGFQVSGHIAGVCGVSINADTELLACVSGTIATILVLLLTLWRKK